MSRSISPSQQTMVTLTGLSATKQKGNKTMNSQLAVKWPSEKLDIATNSEKSSLGELAQRAITGGREDLVTLCETISRDVLFRVMRWVSNRQDAEDISQIVLMRVCENIYKLKKPLAFRGWLNSIIKNEINRHYRNNSRNQNIVSIDEYYDIAGTGTLVEVDVESLPSEYVLREEERRLVMSLVDKLPKRQLEAILLHYFDGMSITEVAEVMNVTQPAVSRYLSLAKDKVKTDLYELSGRASLLYSVAYNAAGPLMAQAMIDEASMLPHMGTKVVEQVVAKGLSRSMTATAGSIESNGLVRNLTIFATMTLCLAAVIFGCWVANQLSNRGFRPIYTEGEIVFTDSEMNPVTVNPSHIEAWARNERGTLTATHWWITAAGSEAIVDSGDGENADEALTRMINNDLSGEYMFYFSMKDDAGSSYTLHRQFFVNNSP